VPFRQHIEVIEVSKGEHWHLHDLGSLFDLGSLPSSKFWEILSPVSLDQRSEAIWMIQREY
jgi:hypothetical protein